MKKLIASILLLSVLQSEAQKNFDGLLHTEKSFAAYSVKHGVKEAFLNFLDSNGIVFEQGKGVNGIEAWKQKTNGPQVLNWRPQFAEISASKDFGYTTGPWELKPNDGTDTVIARGQFTTVWHVDKNGQWKFLVDLGTGNAPAGASSEEKKISAKKSKGKPNTDELLKAEQAFITAFKKDKANAYALYLSNQSILNRNSYLPAVTKAEQLKTIENTPAAIQFNIEGSGIAPSGDLAYVYGNTVINNKPENYLHIWRREKDGWKLALEVLRYR
jgi:ketosteroid isomerase-like protein